jgi:thioesterase domain-containing protein
MARDYVKELLEFQPEGPYFIVGECVGGIVAYEMGQVLHERGKEVGLLFLMDTPRPTATIYIRYKLGLLIKRFVKALGYLYDIARLDFRAVSSMLQRKRRRLVPLTAEERIQKRVGNAELRYITTLSRYRARPYPGKLTFLVSEEEMVHSIHTADQWKNLPMQGMEVHTVPGTHITRLTVYGQITADRLTDCLHRAQDHLSADLETADSAAQSPPILEAQ